jgi:hypothetical protein
LVELLAERVEVGGVFAVEEEACGAESVGEAIFAGSGFAFGGARAGGLGGVLAIGGGAIGDGGEFGLVFLPGGGFGSWIEGFHDYGLLEKWKSPRHRLGAAGFCCFEDNGWCQGIWGVGRGAVLRIQEIF